MERQDLVDGYVRGDITRRTFVRRLTAAGVGLSAALSYAELLRPEAAHAGPGESDYYEAGEWPDREAQMPPDVITESPVAITDTTATARAQIDPNLQTTEVWFEYAEDGGPTLSTVKVVETGDVDRRVPIGLTGLKPSTTYVVRAVAENGSGKTVGGDVAFATTAAPAPPAEAPVATAAAATVAPVTGSQSLTPPADVRGATFRRVRPKAKLAQVLKSGVLPVEVTTDEDATLVLTATLTRPVRGVRAAATRKRKITVATGRASARGGKATTVKLKLKRSARRVLKGRKAATLQLEIRATDRSRNRSLRRQSIRL